MGLKAGVVPQRATEVNGGVNQGGRSRRWQLSVLPVGLNSSRAVLDALARQCQDYRVTSTPLDSNPETAGSVPTATPRNPYLIALAVVGGLAWVLAFMLWIVLESVTDYVTHDAPTASALTIWINILILGGFASNLGATVIAGVGHELRRATRL